MPVQFNGNFLEPSFSLACLIATPARGNPLLIIPFASPEALVTTPAPIYLKHRVALGLAVHLFGIPLQPRLSFTSPPLPHSPPRSRATILALKAERRDDSHRKDLFFSLGHHLTIFLEGAHVRATRALPLLTYNPDLLSAARIR
ncbi:hypothetical protein N7462_004286 [Penicillium macrosclerotiorum]|uniref:uncharacterized protein n=1 Tax=Penicillium macrosclerotiorum TaxID=303699 RepID=UPI002547A08A|nr:uncharacterized protein N7462_004286 [Penicillium macrosclerotiorum]KAJ5689894.1 hypothetical protein N7462_004286 [Penicillium macrosclerotiorum]